MGPGAKARLTAVILSIFIALPALAQTEARQYFGAEKVGSPHAPEPFGSYAKGCIAGAEELAQTGPTWQAMRLSRNRNWGHPETIDFIKDLSRKAARQPGWDGLYIGDISQPRGGPMRSGHRSHQIGLDVDIWMRKPSGKTLTRAAREQIGSISVVSPNRKSVNSSWTPEHMAVLRAAASDPSVARIFVNAAIKDRMCRDARGDRAWLRKIRPWWGHDAHFHVRLSCPAGAQGCENQAPPPPGDGCDETLAWWFSDEALNPKPSPTKKKRKGPLTMADLPAACRALVSQ